MIKASPRERQRESSASVLYHRTLSRTRVEHRLPTSAPTRSFTRPRRPAGARSAARLGTRRDLASLRRPPRSACEDTLSPAPSSQLLSPPLGLRSRGLGAHSEVLKRYSQGGVDLRLIGGEEPLAQPLVRPHPVYCPPHLEAPDRVDDSEALEAPHVPKVPLDPSGYCPRSGAGGGGGASSDHDHAAALVHLDDGGVQREAQGHRASVGEISPVLGVSQPGREQLGIEATRPGQPRAGYDIDPCRRDERTVAARKSRDQPVRLVSISHEGDLRSKVREVFIKGHGLNIACHEHTWRRA